MRRDLHGFVEAAILAPSSHNTQPWFFELSDKRIALYADRTRALPANDPDDRELFISCGAALFNIRVAAANAGVGAQVKRLPDPKDADLLAVVVFDGQPEPGDAALFQEIPRRRTYRKRFESRVVADTLLIELVGCAELEAAALRILRDDGARRETAKLVLEGDAIQWADPSWRRELAAWLHPRRDGDGLAVPGLAAPFARAVVRTFDMGNSVGARDGELADESAVLAVLGTMGDGREDWLSTGQALERVLLSARRAGLQASFLNQPVQVASLRPRLRSIACSDLVPQILLRLGYAKDDLRATPRRCVQDVIRVQASKLEHS